MTDDTQTYVLGKGWLEEGIVFIRAESEAGAKAQARELVEDTDDWFVVTTTDDIESEIDTEGYYEL